MPAAPLGLNVWITGEPNQRVSCVARQRDLQRSGEAGLTHHAVDNHGQKELRVADLRSEAMGRKRRHDVDFPETAIRRVLPSSLRLAPNNTGVRQLRLRIAG